MRAPNLLLDLARLADLPFTVSWFFLANTKLRERSMGAGWEGVVPAALAARPKETRDRTLISGFPSGELKGSEGNR